jgi:hypothetical protein
MRFPSIKTLTEGFLSTLKRYPFELLFALAGTIAGTIEVELKHLNRIDEGWLVRLVMTANLGLLLSLSATLFTQSREMSKRNSFLIKLGAAIFASSLIFIIDPTAREADYIRFFLLSLAFHLLVAFAAFTGKGQVNGFWQFNKTLFLRFLTSILYGVVLFLGIAAAIGATNFLFNFHFEWDTYAILWVWIVGMFTTTFFLAGVPVDTAALNEDLSYPKALKIFTQYVLIPLSTIYVLILLAYEIKILIQWRLPKGLVSDLILSYAVFGILSLLLVYPIREHDGNKWLKTYARSFYFLMVPLLGLLFVAVGARVFKYGITEWRYFLIVLACWLLFISVYFLAFKKQNIKLIPISLCVLTLLSVYGPQSAFSVSMYSQRRIIIKFFEKNNALKQGLFVPIDSTHIDPKAASEAVAQLNYFVFKYDLSPLQPYIKKDLTLVNDSLGKLTSNPKSDIMISRYELRQAKYEWVRKYVGLHHFDTWYNKAERVINQYQFIAANKIRNIKGYDFAFDPGYLTDSLSDRIDGIMVNSKTVNNKVYVLKINNETFRFDIAGLANGFLKNLKKMDRYKQPSQEYDYQNTYKVPVEMLEITKQGRGFDVLLMIESMTVSDQKEIENANPNYPNIGFAYYIKRK